MQNGFDLIPTGFSLDSASATLGGLTTVSHETVVVAFVAGVAGMLALETRASFSRRSGGVGDDDSRCRLSRGSGRDR